MLKYLQVLKNRKTKIKFCEEYNKKFFINLRLEKVSELKQTLINRIKTQNLPDKNTDFQEVKFYFFILDP